MRGEVKEIDRNESRNQNENRWRSLFWICAGGLKKRRVRARVICSQWCLSAGGRIIKTDGRSARRGQCDGQSPSSLSLSDEEREGPRMAGGAGPDVSFTFYA